jgi:hypothetical protein
MGARHIRTSYFRQGLCPRLPVTQRHHRPACSLISCLMRLSTQHSIVSELRISEPRPLSIFDCAGGVVAYLGVHCAACLESHHIPTNRQPGLALFRLGTGSLRSLLLLLAPPPCPSISIYLRPQAMTPNPCFQLQVSLVTCDGSGFVLLIFFELAALMLKKGYTDRDCHFCLTILETRHKIIFLSCQTNVRSKFRTPRMVPSPQIPLNLESVTPPKCMIPVCFLYRPPKIHEFLRDLHLSCAMCPFLAVVRVNSAPQFGQLDFCAAPDFSR